MQTSNKLWRDMTPQEKDALLLAHHEGKVIQYFFRNRWRDTAYNKPSWYADTAYRISPKRETMTLYYGLTEDQSPCDTHRITFDLIDGKPDCDSIKMEEL